jgi:hypothetical protein
MYRGFQLRISPLSYSKYKPTGDDIYTNFSTHIKPILSEFILPNGTLDGDKMQRDWFPDIDADIFISHSYNNRDIAISLAGWLYEKFGIIAFIDSCIWRYAGNLLRTIDNNYCWSDQRKETYNYLKRNKSTAHVNNILSIALSKMIDRTECLFFLKTPESTFESIMGDSTYSPWIYYEISQSQLIRKKIPSRLTTNEYVKLFSKGVTLNESQKEELRIEYMLELNHLQQLSVSEMNKWEYNCNALHLSRDDNPLDILYNIKKIKQ